MQYKHKEEGAILLHQRNRFHMTQLETAEKAQIQFGVYQRYEYGVHSLSMAHMKTGLALCALLDIDPYILTFGIPRSKYIAEMKKLREQKNK